MTYLPPDGDPFYCIQLYDATRDFIQAIKQKIIPIRLRSEVKKPEQTTIKLAPPTPIGPPEMRR